MKTGDTSSGAGRPLWWRHRTPWLLGLFAFLVYVPGFWWGAPHATAADRTNAWGVDDEPPLGPLAQAHDIIKPKAEQNPNLGYPMLHPFMVLATFAPYMGYQLASGQLKSPTVAFPHGFADPETALRTLTLLAHFLSVLLAVGVVMCAYGMGRTLWNERSGIAAAVAAMLVYPMFYYARNSNVDVPVLFFTAAGLWSFTVIVRDGFTMRRALGFGCLVGLAVATKEPSFASFVFAPLVVLLLPDPGTTGLPLRRADFWRMALAAAGVSLVAYALAGGLVIDHRRWIAHIEFIRSRLTDLEANGVVFVTYYPRTLQGHVDFMVRLATLLADALSWPGLVLGAGTMIAVARHRRRDGILALSALGYLGVIFVSARAAQLRYVMPAALVIAVYAGHGAVLAWERRTVWRVPALALATSGVVLLTLWAADLTAGMLRDSRYEAGRWIASNARPGDALEYFGSEHKHPPMPATLSSRHAIPSLGSMVRADTSAQAVATITDGWRERRPRFVILVPDYTNPGKPHAASCPPAVYRGLEDGTMGYRRVAFFETPALFPFARRPALDHPVVNPPIRLYERVEAGSS